MGYGTGMEVKLNTENYLYIKYNGRNFVPVKLQENIKSWDCVGDVHTAYGLRSDLLKYEMKIESLNQEDRVWLKNDGWVKGQENTVEWEDKPEGDFWGGYTRPAIDMKGIKRTFPIELKGYIYISGFGRRSVFVTIKPESYEKVIDMFRDMMESSIPDGDVEEYMKEYEKNEEEEISFEQARQMMWDDQKSDFDANWKA